MKHEERRLYGFIPDTIRGTAAIIGLSAVMGASISCGEADKEPVPTAQTISIPEVEVPSEFTKKEVVGCVNFSVTLYREQQADLQRHIEPLLDHQTAGYSKHFKRHPFGTYRIFAKHVKPEKGEKYRARLTFKDNDEHVRRTANLTSNRQTYYLDNERGTISASRSEAGGIDISGFSCEDQ